MNPGAPGGPIVLAQAQGERRLIDGPAGAIEVQIDAPASPARGFAFVGHPHPLYGGTLDNKVAATLARAFTAMGWIAVRPNFRGVGRSTGVYDDGRGETQDFLHLIDTLPRQAPWNGRVDGEVRIAVAGFSFGSFVAAQACAELVARGARPDVLVLVGAAAGKWPMPPVDPTALVIHGELDTTIPLADVLAWARPQELPIVVLPGAEHFFHRRLTELKRVVIQNVLGAQQWEARSASAPETGEGDG